jgi:signal transduction histidine kinase
MASFFEQVYVLITTNPGNLAYHLVLAFSIAGALQAAMSQWRSGSGSPAGLRLAAGLAFLLFLRLFLFLVAALAWENNLLSAHLLAPLDRSAAYLGLVGILWLWAFPQPSKFADAAFLSLALLTLTLAGIGLVGWSAQTWVGQTGTTPGAGLAYNGSWLDTAGEAFAALLALLGILILLIRRPLGWGAGLAMLGLLLIGHAAHLIAPLPAGDYSGAVRLSQLAAYPLLFTLLHRIPVSPPLPRLPASVTTSSGWSSQREPTLAGPSLQSFLALACASSPEATYKEITRLVAQLMGADVCLLVSPIDNREHLLARTGYNHSKNEFLTDFNLSGQVGYNLNNALSRGRPLRVSTSSSPADLIGLAPVIGVNRPGDLLLAPLSAPEQTHPTGLLLLSPYTQRSWTHEDLDYLVVVAESLSNVIDCAENNAGIKGELTHTRTTLDASKGQLDQIRRETEELLSQLEETRAQAADDHTRAESLAALLDSHEKAQETVALLESEVIRLKKEMELKPASKPQEVAHLEAELRLALEEVANLNSALNEPGRKKSPGAPSISESSLAEVSSIAQELRQPMASMVGYTDLLLGESAGILGAMQRKFLERIKASTERMGALVEDLIQLAVVDTDRPALLTETVDLNSVIDEAIALTISQMREKSIILRVDIPYQLPSIHADRDSLQQILIHLLQNANSATPLEGEISLHARLREDAGKQEYILLQVSDTGGGIPSEDLPRIFSRLYRIDNNKIPGAGDNGIGLSIVKSLVESHGGRIWVDTEQNKGSTFSILLPTTSQTPQNGSGEGPA